MKVSIIILNWNGGADDCIESVKSAQLQDYLDKEIIFVDNASTDGSFEAVKAKFPELIFIQTESNLGCPGGRNVGASAATGDLVVFLENDGIWESSDVVSAMVKQFTERPAIGALYIRVEGYQSRIADFPIDKTVDKDVTTGLYLSSSFRGGASAIRRDLFNKIGLFPSDFVRQYEERYVSLLVYQMGYEVVYFPEKVLLHKGSDYQGKSEAVIKFNCINELKTIKRIYPAYIWPIFFAIKMLLWCFRLLRHKRSELLVEIVRVIFDNAKKDKRLKRINLTTLLKTQSIRYGGSAVQISRL